VTLPLGENKKHDAAKMKHQGKKRKKGEKAIILRRRTYPERKTLRAKERRNEKCVAP